MGVAVTGYLNVAGFRLRTAMPGADVDTLETLEPDFLQTALNEMSAWMNARLKKQYAVPFDLAAPPIVVLRWLAQLVTPMAKAKLGWSPSGESDRAAFVDPGMQAAKEIQEAADSKEGLFELPLRSDTTASGATRTAPLGYSEASPYAWMNEQLTRAIVEDGNR
jgi:hypothetical protein